MTTKHTHTPGKPTPVKYATETIAAALKTFIESGSANGNEALREECLDLVPKFAAAPELLQALQSLEIAATSVTDVIWHHAHPDMWKLFADRLQAARAALARVEGKGE